MTQLERKERKNKPDGKVHLILIAEKGKKKKRKESNQRVSKLDKHLDFIFIFFKANEKIKVLCWVTPGGNPFHHAQCFHLESLTVVNHWAMVLSILPESLALSADSAVGVLPCRRQRINSKKTRGSCPLHKYNMFQCALNLFQSCLS